MEPPVGQVLVEFEEALNAFRGSVSRDGAIEQLIFNNTREWRDLLTYKLIPHLAGQGCLVVAVAGGTNTGKSTVFNVMVGRPMSPVMTTAAATCHPVLAANETRVAECLEGKLVPEFKPVALDNGTDVLDPEIAGETLFVARAENLPDRLIVMDTPDIDSIDTHNWQLAEHMRAAGDVLLAVVTGEKYKDQRVIDFFREAHASGCVIVPLMNKANPDSEFDVARQQLQEFQNDIGIDSPGFVLPHDFNLSENLDRPIESINGGPDLMVHLEALDVRTIKERVFKGTVDHFADQAQHFLAHVDEVGDLLRGVVKDAHSQARATADKFDPTPGPEVGGLFHEFIQAKRGPIRRAIGTAGAAVSRTASALGRRIGAALRTRATLESEEDRTAETLDRHHKQAITDLVRDLATRQIETGRTLREPARHLLQGEAEALEIDPVIERILEDTLGTTNISDTFRKHAWNTLESWWADNTGKRRVLEALDGLLAAVPAAIAVPISIHTGGVGVPEAMVVVGPIAAQFATRVMEYQFGDAMFDFLSPWKEERQRIFEQAILTHLTQLHLKEVQDYLALFEGKHVNQMKRCQKLCRTASSQS